MRPPTERSLRFVLWRDAAGETEVDGRKVLLKTKRHIDQRLRASEWPMRTRCEWTSHGIYGGTGQRVEMLLAVLMGEIHYDRNIDTDVLKLVFEEALKVDSTIVVQPEVGRSRDTVALIDDDVNGAAFSASEPSRSLSAALGHLVECHFDMEYQQIDGVRVIDTVAIVKRRKGSSDPHYTQIHTTFPHEQTPPGWCVSYHDQSSFLEAVYADLRDCDILMSYGVHNDLATLVDALRREGVVPYPPHNGHLLRGQELRYLPCEARIPFRCPPIGGAMTTELSATKRAELETCWWKSTVLWPSGVDEPTPLVACVRDFVSKHHTDDTSQPGPLDLDSVAERVGVPHRKANQVVVGRALYCLQDAKMGMAVADRVNMVDTLLVPQLAGSGVQFLTACLPGNSHRYHVNNTRIAESLLCRSVGNTTMIIPETRFGLSHRGFGEDNIPENFRPQPAIRVKETEAGIFANTLRIPSMVFNEVTIDFQSFYPNIVSTGVDPTTIWESGTPILSNEGAMAFPYTSKVGHNALQTRDAWEAGSYRLSPEGPLPLLTKHVLVKRAALAEAHPKVSKRLKLTANATIGTLRCGGLQSAWNLTMRLYRRAMQRALDAINASSIVPHAVTGDSFSFTIDWSVTDTDRTTRYVDSVLAAVTEATELPIHLERYCVATLYCPASSACMLRYLGPDKYEWVYKGRYLNSIKGNAKELACNRWQARETLLKCYADHLGRSPTEEERAGHERFPPIASVAEWVATRDRLATDKVGVVHHSRIAVLDDFPLHQFTNNEPDDFFRE
jgi:hypothetical protein